MRVLLSFLLGVVVGAAGLFVWLRQLPHDAATGAPTVAATDTGSLPAPRDPAAPPQPAASPQANGPDLADLDLPLRPGVGDAPAPAPAAPSPAVPASPPAASAGTPAPAAGPAIPDGKLMVPVDGVAFTQLTDTFDQARGAERRHEALDIMAPKGTKVVAAADGKVVKLFTSKPGGLTVYQFDPSEKYAYYYAHLDRYADGLKEGAMLHRGDPIGYVGSTGNADPNAPHLHFAVFALTPEKQWWKGTPIDPYPMMRP
jgi:murein DD-endopeptidase MepM/ murein hydrolase activator NlpD